METDDIEFCEKCGVLYDIEIVKKRKCEYTGKPLYAICPVCGNEKLLDRR